MRLVPVMLKLEIQEQERYKNRLAQEPREADLSRKDKETRTSSSWTSEGWMIGIRHWNWATAENGQEAQREPLGGRRGKR